MTASAVAAPSAVVVEQFEEMFSRYYRWVRARLYRSVNDWHLADDLAEELFAKLWREMSTGRLELEDIEELRPYLAARARWLVTRHFRDKALRPETPIQIFAETAAVTVSAESHVIDRVEVGRLLAMLPARHRRAVALFALEGLSRQEIADQTGYSEQTVKSHLQQATAMLRDAVGAPKFDRTKEAEGRQEQARAVFLASVEAGKPLSGGALARRFGMGVDWGQRLIAATGYQRPQSKRARLMQALTEDMQTGQVPAGERFPRTSVLAKRFGVDDATVSCALTGLVGKGLVHRADGGFYAAPATARTARPAFGMAA